MKYLGGRGVFEAIRHDGTYRVATSLIGQPKPGAKIRRIEGFGRRAAIGQNPHGFHQEEPMRGELEGGKYLGQMRVIYTDRSRDFDCGDYWSLRPNLTAFASDPLRRCVEVGSCSGGESARLSALLRKYTASSPRRICRTSRGTH